MLTVKLQRLLLRPLLSLLCWQLLSRRVQYNLEQGRAIRASAASDAPESCQLALQVALDFHASDQHRAAGLSSCRSCAWS